MQKTSKQRVFEYFRMCGLYFKTIRRSVCIRGCDASICAKRQSRLKANKQALLIEIIRRKPALQFRLIKICSNMSSTV